MRGTITQRSKKAFTVIVDLGHEIDPITGKKKRRQKWVAVEGKRKDAEDKLTDLLKEVKDGTAIDPTKITVGEWLREWLPTIKKRVRPGTFKLYERIIENHMVSSTLGRMALQKVRGTHIEAYYAAATVSASTLRVHHAILHQSMRKAAKTKLILANVAHDLHEKPQRKRNRDDARKHCWTAREATAFLEAAKERGPMWAALAAVALDSGARRGELGGLTWREPFADLDKGLMHIVQQLT